MTALTKQDLQDWNSQPVTRALAKRIEEAIQELKSESCLRETCDQTAMQTAYVDGQISGVDAMNEVYEDMLSEAE